MRSSPTCTKSIRALFSCGLARLHASHPAMLVQRQGLKQHTQDMEAFLARQRDKSDVEVALLKENVLAFFPMALLDFGNLRRLDLSFNCLRVVPAAICELRGLEELCLECNSLRWLPGSLGKLKKLHRLTLHDNPLPPQLAVSTWNSAQRHVQLIAQHYCFDECVDACMALVACRVKAQSEVLHLLPKDVVILIAKRLFDTRHDPVWKKKESKTL